MSSSDPVIDRVRRFLEPKRWVASAGVEITPHVRLVRPLGRGGMGSVWVAEHSTLRCQVAVKLMLKDDPEDASALERFQREASAVAGIRSAHVVTVHDHGLTADDVPYIVMELLEGEDLGSRLARDGPLDLGLTVTIVDQVARALARAHEAGVVHRDIKPGNVFLTRRDATLVVKLLDFGIAKHAEPKRGATTATGLVLGTPLYMSPEQVLGSKDVGERSDLWSLAVVTYECLTGRPPFDGETVGAISVAVERARFAPATEARPDLPAEIDAWFARALARDPAGRFASAIEMAEALSRAARGAATPSPPSTSGGRRSHPTAAPASGADRARGEAPRRSRLLLATIGLLALAAVALGAFLQKDRPRAAAAGGPVGIVPSGKTISIAVPPFSAVLPRFGSDAPPPLPVTAADVVGTLLRRVDGVRVVGATDLAFRVGPAQPRDERWERAAAELGAALAVRGTLENVDGRVRGTVELVDITAGGATLVRATDEAAPSDIDDLLTGLARTLANSLVPGAEVTSTGTKRSAESLELYEKGVSALMIGRAADAALYLQRAVEEQPEFFEAWFRLAQARGWFGAPEQDQVDAADRAAALAPPGREQALMNALSLHGRSQFGRAAAMLRPLYEADRRDIETTYLLADALWHDGRHGEGAALFNAALELAPGFGLAAMHLVGHALSHRDEARARFYIGILDRAQGGPATPDRQDPRIAFALRRWEDVPDTNVYEPLRAAALSLAGKDEEAKKLLEKRADVEAMIEVDLLSRALARGDEVEAQRRLDAVWSRATAAGPLDIVVAHGLFQVLVAGAQREPIIALAELYNAHEDQISAPYRWTFQVHAAALLGRAELLDVDSASEDMRMGGEAARAEIRGDHAEAARIWRSRLADPGEAGDQLERIALARNLHVLGRAEELRAVCAEIAEPAIFNSLMHVATRVCVDWGALRQPPRARSPRPG